MVEIRLSTRELYARYGSTVWRLGCNYRLGFKHPVNRPSPQRPRRILIVRSSHLGDVVCTLPLFHGLRRGFGEAQIAWVIQTEFSGLLKGLAGLDRVIEFERKGGLLGWLRLRANLRAFAPDLTIDAQGNLKSAAITRLSAAPVRLGFARQDWQEPAGIRALTAQADAAPGPHLIERTTNLANFALERCAADCGAKSTWRRDPGLSAAELARGEALAEHWISRPSARTVLVHAAPDSNHRSWPHRHVIPLIENLLFQGRDVVLITGPGERILGRDLRNHLKLRPGLRHWIARSDVRELAAFMAAAATRDATLLCNDSGPMHLAASVGLPVVLLQGPTNVARSGPWPLPKEDSDRDPGPAGDQGEIGRPAAASSPHRLIRALDSPECAPCSVSRCTHPDGNVCMTRLQPEEVLARL